MIWRLRQHGKISHKDEERIEKKAMKLISVTFFVLAAYIFYEAVRKLIVQEPPEVTIPGIMIACISIIIMPVLAIQKYRIGKRIRSKALVADSKETLACFTMSIALLLGLLMNALLGFWQADPVAGIIIALYLVREGREVWLEAHEEAGE